MLGIVVLLVAANTHFMIKLLTYIIVYIYMFSFISYAQEDNYINKQVKKSYFGLYSGPVFFKEKYFYHEVSLNNNSLFDRFNYGFDAGCYYITHIFDSDFYVQMEANYSYMKYELNYYDWSKVPGQFSYIDSVNYMIYSSCIRFAFIPTYKISDKKNIFIRIGPFMNFTLKSRFLKNSATGSTRAG